MAACRQCQTELASIGCARCSPQPNVELLDEIERDARWSRASSHRVGSQRGKSLFWIGGGIGVVALLMLPSYCDAVEEGDRSGTGLMIGMAIVAGLSLLGGVAFTVRKLRHRAAIVLTTTFHAWQDSKGRTTRSYHVHAFTRGGPVSLVAESEHAQALSPGDALILFVRGDYLDDTWRVEIARKPAWPAAADSTAPAEAAAVPPANASANGGAASTADAVALLASLSPAERARAEAVRVVRPWSLYAQQLATAAFGVFILVVPLLVGDDSSQSVDGPEAYEQRSRIISIVTTVLGVGILAVSGFLALRKRRRPLATTVAVVVGSREMRIGSSLLSRIEVIERDGRQREVAATREVSSRILVGEPYVLWSLDGKVLQVQRIGR